MGTRRTRADFDAIARDGKGFPQTIRLDLAGALPTASSSVEIASFTVPTTWAADHSGFVAYLADVQMYARVRGTSTALTAKICVNGNPSTAPLVVVGVFTPGSGSGQAAVGDPRDPVTLKGYGLKGGDVITLYNTQNGTSSADLTAQMTLETFGVQS